MQPEAEVPDRPPPDDSGEAGLPRLVFLAVIGGVLTGLLGGAFRFALVETSRWWESVLVWSRDLGGWRLVLPVLGAAVAVAVARLIVRWSPESSGSGVHRVEALMRHEDGPAPLRVVPAKFVGGTLAIGVGMALGREGPTVQMGASVGGEIARRGRLDAHDTRTLSASLAGAGLGVAFGAPLGGAAFVLEELARAIRTRLVVATLVASGVALAVALPLIGTRPVFPVPPIEGTRLWHLAIYAPMGLLIGWLGIHYNRSVIWNLDAMDRLRLPPEVKAGVVGALVGALGVAAPWLVGGGEVLAERVLTLGLPFGALVLTLVVRWFLGPLSYAAGTPGGLFAPLLVVGAGLGSLTATLCNMAFPGLDLPVEAFAMVGMSTFFAAVVRAPVTGILLCVEMTATTTVLVPMLVAAALATALCTVRSAPPIYDTLRLRMEGYSAPG